MGAIREVQKVKLFLGMIYASPEAHKEAICMAQQKWGEIDLMSPQWPFDFTNYYEAEMGKNLGRQFIAFRNLIDPAEIRKIKLDTNLWEEKLSSRYAPPSRPINLDPGYLTLAKIVLATTKDYTHRIYLGDGIYAEVTLYYQAKKFTASSWTYPDYQSPHYLQYFEELRHRYKGQLASPGC